MSFENFPRVGKESVYVMPFENSRWIGKNLHMFVRRRWQNDFFRSSFACARARNVLCRS